MPWYPGRFTRSSIATADTSTKSSVKPRAATKSTKGKKRAHSPAGSDVSIQPAAKKRKAADRSADAEAGAEPPDLASCAQALVELAPQMVRLLSVMGSVPYDHPTLATAPDFLSGLPASTLMPKKEPAGSRRVNVKRLPAWNLEPGLETFGPYVKKAGVAYSLKDLSIFARALPDVSDHSLLSL